MAFNVSALADYTEQNEALLVTSSVLGAKTASLIKSAGNVMVGVKSSETINIMDTDAVFQSGGKQHRVTEGQTLRLELLDLEQGATVEFPALMIVNGDDVKIGTPVVEGSKVVAEVIAHDRGDKVKIVKFRRRKHYRKQAGHRQWFTEVKITGISA